MTALLRYVLSAAAILVLIYPATAKENAPASWAVDSPEFFPILPWSPYHGWNKPEVERGPAGLESIAECGFNMAGFVLPRDLRRCEKLGLGAIVLPSDPAYTNSAYLRAWRSLSDAEIDRRVRDLVRAAGSRRTVAGFYIIDEPHVRDFPALGKAVAAVKKYAPGKLAYINLFPEYATLGATNRSQLGTSNYTEYLERFVAEVKPQVISYDNYMVQFSDDLANTSRAASYYRNLLEVRRVAQKHGLPFLNIVCCNQIRPHTPIPSPANLAFQAYTTLAAGYRGVTWFNYYGPGYKHTPIDTAGNKTLTWVYLRDINHQVAALAPTMARLRSTGVYFHAAPVEGLPGLPGKVVDAVSSAAPVMIGEFEDASGATLCMVVNLSLERSAKISIGLTNPGSEVEMASPLTGRFGPVDTGGGFWLCAGHGALLRVGDSRRVTKETKQ